MRVCFLCGFVLVFAVFAILVGSLGCKFAAKRAVDGAEVVREAREVEPTQRFLVLPTLPVVPNGTPGGWSTPTPALKTNCKKMGTQHQIDWNGSPYISGEELVFSGQVLNGKVIHDSRTVIGVENGVEQTVAAFMIYYIADTLEGFVGVGRIWHPELAAGISWDPVVNLYPLADNYSVEGDQFAVRVELPADVLALKEDLVVIVAGEYTGEIDFLGEACVIRH